MSHPCWMCFPVGVNGPSADAVHSRTSYSKATPSGIVLLEPRFRGVRTLKDLQMVLVAGSPCSYRRRSRRNS